MLRQVVAGFEDTVEIAAAQGRGRRPRYLHVRQLPDHLQENLHAQCLEVWTSQGLGELMARIDDALGRVHDFRPQRDAMSQARARGKKDSAERWRHFGRFHTDHVRDDLGPAVEDHHANGLVRRDVIPLTARCRRHVEQRLGRSGNQLPGLRAQPAGKEDAHLEKRRPLDPHPGVLDVSRIGHGQHQGIRQLEEIPVTLAFLPAQEVAHAASR